MGHLPELYCSLMACESSLNWGKKRLSIVLKPVSA